MSPSRYPTRYPTRYPAPIRHRVAALAGASITVLSLTLAAALMLPTQALAQAPTGAAGAPTTATLNFQQLVESLAKLGYKDFREVERKSDKLYEVKARDSRGAKVELTVDARSGEVLREKFER